MSTSKHFDKLCIAAVAIMLVVTILFMCGEKLGLTVASRAVKYESTLFDMSYVHQIDIVMNDWDSFIETCENEEYAVCTAVIDGNKQTNVALRAKGNTSLSSVRASGSQRYSFKMEFDHFEDGKTYDGLDKLCLNNLIQDNTMMKDYISYYLMNDFGADSPLCAFAYLTVNGEDWGLYLAVEGIEDSFLSRNYGAEAGELYKPDSLSFGGGRGNGKDFNMDEFDFSGSSDEDQEQETPQQDTQSGGNDETSGSQGVSFGGQMPEGMTPPDGAQMPEGMTPPSGFPGFPSGEDAQDGAGSGGSFPSFPGGGGQQGGPGSGGSFPGFPGGDSQQGGPGSGGSFPGFPGGDSQQGGADFGGSFPGFSGGEGQESGEAAGDGEADASSGERKMPGGMGFGMGSDDVKLKYIDDDPDSYGNIFNNAKTDVSNADKKRLIASLEKLNAYEDLEEVLDTEEVLRYFVVHNFVCNGDSYTGMMIHNYYLHECDGRLSMIPWDYNLAFGTFQGGDASGTVNTSIDSPITMGNVDDRPMLGWIFSDESYTEQYHKLFSEFIEKWFTNGALEQLIADTAEMIRPYVEKDPTKFCTMEDFDKGVTALKQFISLRGETVERQLAGDETAVETGSLNLSDMGSMGGGMGKGMGGFSGSFDAASMIQLADQDGNAVALSDVIADGASIKSIALSDGTTVDVSDVRTLMKADLSQAVSVTDQDGNVTDLSAYTVSVTVPSAAERGAGSRGGSESRPDASGQTQEKGAGQSSGEIPAMPGNQQNDQNGAAAANGSFTPPGGFSDGAKQGESSASDQTEAAANSGESRPASGENGRQTPPSGFPGSAGAGNSKASFWILCGASAAVLALGILIALKKKSY